MNSFFDENIIITYIKQAAFFPLDAICYTVHKNRQYHGFVIHNAGKRYYHFSDGTTIVNGPGDLLYLPKGSNYTVESLEESTFYAINFDIDTDKKMQPFNLSLKNPSVFFESAKKMDNLWRKQLPFYKTKCMSYLYQFVYLLNSEYRNQYNSSKYKQLLAPAMEYIHSNYTYENISIPKLAELCKVSESYFRRIFLQTLMVSPIKYINNLRLTRAKELLSSGTYNISTIAELSGFQNDAYFSREFKKAFDMSPTEFKKVSPKE